MKFKLVASFVYILAFTLVHSAPAAVEPVQTADNNGTETVFTKPDIVIQGDIATPVLPRGNGKEKNANKAYYYGTKWQNGIIPYYINFAISEPYRSYIKQAMKKIEEQTFNCVRFAEYNYNYYVPGWLHIKSDKGCWSYVGQAKGEQWLSLGPGCYSQSTIIHELLHAVGFWHEQARPDRDNYVRIHWDNIPKAQYSEFEMKSREIDTLNAPYDYDSIMHYKYNTFARNNMYPSITPLDSRVNMYQIGRRNDLSPIDVAKIRRYYNCDAHNWG